MNKVSIIGLIIFALIGLFLFDCHRYSSGYCYAEKRYVASEEYTNDILEKVLEKHSEVAAESDDSEAYYKYESVGDFTKANPLCCPPFPPRNGINNSNDQFIYRTEIMYKPKKQSDEIAKVSVQVDACNARHILSYRP